MNDVMILRDKDGNENGEFGVVELRQLTDAPGVLAGGQVLRTTTELTRLKGDWIRFPTVSGLLQFEFVRISRVLLMNFIG
jgi:hypothetical protein